MRNLILYLSLTLGLTGCENIKYEHIGKQDYYEIFIPTRTKLKFERNQAGCYRATLSGTQGTIWFKDFEGDTNFEYFTTNGPLPSILALSGTRKPNGTWTIDDSIENISQKVGAKLREVLEE